MRSPAETRRRNLPPACRPSQHDGGAVDDHSLVFVNRVDENDRSDERRISRGEIAHHRAAERMADENKRTLFVGALERCLQLQIDLIESTGHRTGRALAVTCTIVRADSKS